MPEGAERAKRAKRAKGAKKAQSQAERRLLGGRTDDS